MKVSMILLTFIYKCMKGCVKMTDSEKEQRINQLYGERSKYAEKLEQYQAALGYAAAVSDELQDLGKKLASMQEVVFSNFVIKGAPGDAGRIEILIGGVGQLYSFLAGACASAINDEIKKLSEKIASCESQIYSIQNSN